MAEKEVNVKVRLRTDGAANWFKTNPVLLRGEIGIEEDTGKIKAGDGVTKWRALPYLNTGQSRQEVLDCFFPVNSVKITASDVNPDAVTGGVWERLKTDGVLYYWVRTE